MPCMPKTDIKDKFKTGMKPTQQDFACLIDSFVETVNGVEPDDTGNITLPVITEDDLKVHARLKATDIPGVTLGHVIAEHVLTNAYDKVPASHAVWVPLQADRKDINYLAKEVNQLKIDVPANTTSIGALTTTVTANTGSITALQTDVDNLKKNDSSTLATKVDKNTTDIATLSGGVTVNTNDITTNTNSIKGLASQVTSNISDIATAYKRNLELNQLITDLTARVAKLEKSTT